MKRRNLLAASVGCVGGLIPGLTKAATPCPPPTVSVVGGTSATTSCPVTSGAYSTNFPGTENPISEGGKWVNGKVTGGSWNNVQTTTGLAFAANFVSGYDDPIAVLNNSLTANQYAQGTVHRVGGYSPGVNHEIELLLRFQVTSGNARGYEVLWAHEGYIAIVRWNGPLGNYTPLVDGLVIGQAVEGDVLRAEITNGVIKVYKNGTLVASTSDTTWASGQPGMGFWPKPGATLSSYGWKAFQAGNL